MTPDEDLLEAYRLYRPEIDILQDEVCMWVLYTLQTRSTIKKLSKRLSMSQAVIIAICAQLRNAKMIDLEDLDAIEQDFGITAKGQEHLDALS